MTGGGLARSGLFQTAAGVETTVTLAASAVRHVGWWLEWQTRSRTADGCRVLPGASPPPEATEVLPVDAQAT